MPGDSNACKPGESNAYNDFGGERGASIGKGLRFCIGFYTGETAGTGEFGIVYTTFLAGVNSSAQVSMLSLGSCLNCTEATFNSSLYSHYLF